MIFHLVSLVRPHLSFFDRQNISYGLHHLSRYEYRVAPTNTILKTKKRIQYKINLHKILGADEPIPLLVKDPEGLPDVPLDVRVPELPKKSDLLSTAQITIVCQNKDVCACWYALKMEACVYQSR